MSPREYDNNLLEDIESALICELQPKYNISKVRGYTYRTEYFVNIINEGFRGGIPRQVDAKEQYYIK